MDRPTQDDGRVHGVIVGCSDGGGRWLLIRRGEKVVAPGQVCFPGGAVEPDEDRDAAAVREMREELGINLTVTGPIWQHIFDDRPLILWGYLANEVAADLVPDPYEVAEVLWLNRREVLDHPDAMPMTELFVEALEAASAKKG